MNIYIETHLEHPEWYKVFLEKMKNKIGRFDPKLFSTLIIKAATNQLEGKKDIKVLAVGAGKGSREIPILKELIKKGKNISFDYLDIQVKYFEEFVDKLNQEKMSEILSQSYIVDWKDFRPKKPYDLVLALYCFYGSKKHTKQNLYKIFNALKNNGIACTAQTSKKCFINKLFYEVVGKEIVTGELLASYLDELGVNYEIQQIESKNDLSFCVSINNKPISRTAEMFLSYIFNEDYRRFSTKKKQRINEVFIRMSEKGSKLIVVPAVSNLITFSRA